MESYYELSYMESSVQLLNLRDEIRGLQKEKQEMDQKLQAKIKEELELSAKNLRMLKIVNQKMGADKYSPKKHGVGPPTPKKPSTISSTVSSSDAASCGMQLFSSEVASTGPCSPVLSGGPSSSTSGTMKVPVDSPSKGKEITLADAKSILDKYKDSPLKFDVLDDVTDDELLSVDDAVEWLGGGSKQSNVTADMLESNASMAGSDGNINGTQKDDDKNGYVSESKGTEIKNVDLSFKQNTNDVSRGENKRENEEHDVKHISCVSARDEGIPAKDVRNNTDKAKMGNKTKEAKEGKKEASKKEGGQE